MIANTIVLEVLTEKNYGNWKVWLKSYLQGQGLFDIVDGTDVKPVGNQAGLSARKKNNGKALHAIQISCGSDMLSYMRELDTAKEAWDRLATVHEQASGARKAFLEAELRSTKQGNSTISEFCRRVKDLCDQMEGIGIKMENNTKVAIISENLRPEFDAMRVVVQKSKPNMEEAISLFLQEEALLERRKRESNNEVKEKSNEALFSDTRGRSRCRRFRGIGRSQSWQQSQTSNKGGINSPRGPTCYNCGKVGHLSRDCWYKEINYNAVGEYVDARTMEEKSDENKNEEAIRKLCI
ncbi:hypothetical protein NE237_009020 [Protea cynaroides]|uniref:CCHC-type domain-containing protein n=1 Tax=Protea cynaroides TaxID=273540 RepID=A0A9Q0R0B5_9MAGN|nr:hypothetical protein NE237_009020 [Protea cynaroides]